MPITRAAESSTASVGKIERRVSGVRAFRFLAFLVWSACVLPMALLLLLAGRVWGQTAAHTPFTQTLRNLLVYAVLAWAVLMVLRHGIEIFRRPFGTICVTAIALFYPAFASYLHGAGNADELFVALVSFVVALALFSLRLNISHLNVVGGLGALTGALSLGMAWVRPGSAYAYEGGAPVLAGPFDNANYLGTVLILSLPFALLIGRPILRWASIALIVWPILIGGSNTSIVTLLAVSVVAGLMFLMKQPKTRAMFIGFASGIALLTTMALPYVISDDGAFTSRGAIWSRASANVLDFIPFGAGEAWFELNSASAGFSINHAHNMLLHPLIVGGLPYLFAVLAVLVLLMRYGVHVVSRGGSIAASIYTMALVLAGGLGNFFILDVRDLRYFATGFVIVTLLSIATSGSEQRPRTPWHAS